MTQQRIYLDYAATAPLRPEAFEAMLPYLRHGPHNPSSLHAEGRRARNALEDARARIAALIGARRKEIIFTASGSEANALAIAGIARTQPGGRIVSCAIEHHAILRNVEALARDGYEATILPVDTNGVLSVEGFDAALQSGTVLASLHYANNEIGTVEPIAHLASRARSRGIPFHTDAVQASGWLSLDVVRLGVDAMSLSAHKFGGPPGVGILYVRDETPLVPLVYGGGQEAGRRSGTENVAAAVGAAAALEAAERERPEAAKRVAALRKTFECRVCSTIRGARVNGAGAPRLPNVASLSFEGVLAEALAIRLDLEGIAVSPGSACTSGVAEASHVLTAIGAGDPRSGVRFSFGGSTTEAEIDRAAALLPRLVRELREGE